MTAGKQHPSKLILSCCGTPFIDGYVEISMGFIVFILLDQSIASAWQVGAFSSFYLLGTFFGSLFFGFLAERFGRIRFFIALPFVVTVLAATQYFFDSIAIWITFRLLIGFFIGGDYPVSQAMVSEKLAESQRSKALATMMLTWFLGAVFAVFASYVLLESGFGWKTIGVSATLISLTILALRLGETESEKWLEAVGTTQAVNQTPGPKIRFSALYVRRLFFVSIFWLSQAIPVTVFFLFGPSLMKAIGTAGKQSQFSEVAITNLFFLVGTAMALFILDRTSRRSLILSTFLAMAASFAVLLFWQMLSPWMLTAALIFYALAYGIQSTLDFVYPNELFPTAIRTRAIGLLTAISRAGSTLCAFTFPWILENMGVTFVTAMGCLILMIGFATTFFFSPQETASERQPRPI